MDIQWATLVLSVGTSSLFAAGVSTYYQLRFARRAELLDAYSGLFGVLFEMRHTLQLAEERIRSVKDIGEAKAANAEAEREKFRRCKSALWKLQLVEGDKALLAETTTLFSMMFADQLSGDLVAYKMQTNKLAADIDALVERIAHVHGFKSSGWLLPAWARSTRPSVAKVAA